MLTRPKYTEKELNGIKEMALEQSHDVMTRTIAQAKSEEDMTEGITFNEYTAISILANIAINITLQDRGTISEYLAWVNEELTTIHNNLAKDPDLKPHLVGGKEITEA
jgi:nitrous oxidase accessory protein NosD